MSAPVKRRAVRGFLVAASTVAALVALELLLRAAGYSSPAWYRPHPELGWALRPGVSGWFTKEGKGFVQINSAGQRDHEHTVEKPENVYRIAVLGDGYSEAMEVALKDTYWALLSQRLESCGFQRGKRIELLNFAVRDYGTAQAYLVLKTTAVRYRPDLVLLQFSHGNDVRDNSSALDAIKGRPYFTLDARGRPQLDDSFASSEAYLRRASPGRGALRKLVDRSRLLQLARGVRDLKVLQLAHARDTGNVAGLEIPTLSAPRDALWEQAWRITEGLIASIAEFASRNGARLMVVTVPFAMQVHPDIARREALQASLGVSDFAYPERRVASFAESRGIPAITLGPQMQALAEAKRAYLYGFENADPGFGHWNELGHRAAAEIIARRLCANPA